MEIRKQQDAEEPFQPVFNEGMYDRARFTSDFGDRWIHGFQTGGRIIVRVSITSKETASKRDIQTHAEASLRFWGVAGSFSARVKKSMGELDRHAHVDVSIHYQGDMGHRALGMTPETMERTAVEETFEQAKSWADWFVESACYHEYKYQTVLDDYENLANFPHRQKTMDYSAAHKVSYMVLKERVKISELASVLQQGFLTADLKRKINKADIEIGSACKQWVLEAALFPAGAVESAMVLIEKITADFYAKYLRYLVRHPPQCSFIA
ncbi:hypothetical protein CDD83_1573 [Cordyceps sp. RAO-2017]|nr:hypothetical protein CDD83_1573 [Cordyceps sp. RAO-2017]